MPKSLLRTGVILTALSAATFLLSGCGAEVKRVYNEESRGQIVETGRDAAENQQDLITGDGFDLFGSRKKDVIGGGGGGIGVNSFLWRATLDTLSFMPLASADAFGGVIITDWYANPKIPTERFKVTAYILDQRLRADGVRVSIFRQVRSVNGEWVDAEPTKATVIELENTILTRARELHIASSRTSD